MIGEVKLNVF